MQLRELTNDEFDKFSRNFNFFSLYQTREYSFIMHKEGYETSTIGLFDNREIVGAALILIKEIDTLYCAFRNEKNSSSQWRYRLCTSDLRRHAL